jgi:hypothetical protein
MPETLEDGSDVRQAGRSEGLTVDNALLVGRNGSLDSVCHLIGQVFGALEQKGGDFSY